MRRVVVVVALVLFCTDPGMTDTEIQGWNGCRINFYTIFQGKQLIYGACEENKSLL